MYRFIFNLVKEILRYKIF